MTAVRAISRNNNRLLNDDVIDHSGRYAADIDYDRRSDTTPKSTKRKQIIVIIIIIINITRVDDGGGVFFSRDYRILTQ